MRSRAKRYAPDGVVARPARWHNACMISTLVLLRHAKSAYPDDVADHDRPLNARGRRDAPAAGSPDMWTPPLRPCSASFPNHGATDGG